MIIDYDPVLQKPGKCLPVSRAATAIYCVLKQYTRKGSFVLVPANLCYAGILPIIYAGMNPAFCDVDSQSGNVTAETVANAIRQTKPTAMIIPHMYGNPVRDFPEIARICEQNRIILVEDCASAMGAKSDSYTTGVLGDYIVYSTGYSKTLDLGYGGFLVSHKNELKEMEETEHNLEELSPEAEKELQFFSPLYRLIRNQGEGTMLAEAVFQSIAPCLRKGLIHSLSEEKKQEILSALRLLPEIIIKRREGLKEYMRSLHTGDGVAWYKYDCQAVPWRMNLMVNEKELKQQIIRKCLENKLPVSDWYPVVTKLFGNHESYPGASLHEAQILNFPLLNDSQEKSKICQVINILQSKRGLK